MYAPVATADDQTLFFAEGSTARDIYVARRDDGGGFRPREIAAGVNDTDFDEPGSISGDGCRLYIRTIRGGGAGGLDIFVAERPSRR
jgi:hypothetical protein